MSLVKIVLFFLVSSESQFISSYCVSVYCTQLMFTIGQCILILTPQNYEFSVTLVISAAILVLAYPIIYLVVGFSSLCSFFYSGFILRV